MEREETIGSIGHQVSLLSFEMHRACEQHRGSDEIITKAFYMENRFQINQIVEPMADDPNWKKIVYLSIIKQYV